MAIDFAYEDDASWYIRPEPEEFYDNTMWVVDKGTGGVSYLDYTGFLIDFEEKCTPVEDPRSIWD